MALALSEPPDKQSGAQHFGSRFRGEQHSTSSGGLVGGTVTQRNAFRRFAPTPAGWGNMLAVDWGRQILVLTKPFVQGGLQVRQAIPSLLLNKNPVMSSNPISSMHQTAVQHSTIHKTPSPPVAVIQTQPAVSTFGGSILSSTFWLDVLASDTVKHLTAGGIAGAVSRTIVSPLERMKIMMQVQGVGGRHTGSVFANLAKVYREEGLMGYLRGNGTNVIRIVPYSAVQFATYEYCKIKLMDPTTGSLSYVGRLISGALAGAASAIFTYPLDLVRTRLSMDQPSYSKNVKGVVQPPRMSAMMMQIWRTEGGLRGLYQGIVPTVLGLAPYVALNFTAYEFFRNVFTPPPTPTSPSPSPSIVARLACGALAGTVAQTATYPLELLRRRLQITGMKGARFQYNGMWDAWVTIIRQEGLKGLYAGMVPNYLKVVPATAVSFVTYEFTKKYLNA